jgi:hypothetical protein
MSKRPLSERQKLFLEHLFGEAKGNYQAAKVMAGYTPEYSTSELVSRIEDELLEYTKRYLVVHGPKAAISLIGAMDDPTQLGIQYKLAAAKDVLDRVGITKTEKVDVSNGLFILPPRGGSSE